MSEFVEINEAFKLLAQHQAHLTEFQISFITGLKKYYTRNKTLSDKQKIVLSEITRNLKIDLAEKVKISEEPNNQ